MNELKSEMFSMFLQIAQIESSCILSDLRKFIIFCDSGHFFLIKSSKSVRVTRINFPIKYSNEVEYIIRY